MSDSQIVAVPTSSIFILAAPGDYNGTDVTVVFPSGATIMSFPIPIENDDVAESVEQFTVSLFTIDPFAILGPNSTVQINDDREFSIGACIVYCIIA